MDDGIDWDRLARYVFGECSSAEESAIRSWIAADPARAKLMDELRHVWNTTGGHTAHWNTDAIWSRLEAHIRQRAERMPPPATDRAPARKQARRTRPAVYVPVLLMAAVIAIAAVTTILTVTLLEASRTAPAEPGVKTFETQNGQRATIQLSDGTRVRLNVDSKLTLPDGFAGDRREVHLQGEAYFEVARDAHRPFLVRTGDAMVQVLGTAFNVNAYPDVESVQVVVAEGKVSLRPEGADSLEAIVLNPGQEGRLFRTGEQVIQEKVDLSLYLAWMQGRLVFQDAPFDEVARQLARWYDLEIVLTDSSAALGHLNAIFTDEPLSEILNIIAGSLDLTYERKRRTVTFSPKPRSSP